MVSCFIGAVIVLNPPRKGVPFTYRIRLAIINVTVKLSNKLMRTIVIEECIIHLIYF